MKHLILIFLAACSVCRLCAQEQSVTIKEPVEQCYQDLKANLDVLRYDDEHMTVVSRPLLTNMSGNVQMVARVFQEKNDTMCKLVVTFESPDHSVAWNSLGSNALWRSAHTLGAKIESTMKAREKAAKKASKESSSESHK